MTVPVHLTRIRPELNEWRFYRVEIWPDLFGGFSLVREWGRIGQDGQSRHLSFPTKGAATEAFWALIASKRKRGYLIE